MDVSGNGSASDAQIYNNSELKEGLENGAIMGWPRPSHLPNDTQDVPYFLVGDDAFSLMTYLMKSYGTRNMEREYHIYNYRLSRARRVVENTFGILANRFQVLLTTMNHRHGTVRLIVKACVLIHNIMRSRGGCRCVNEYRTNVCVLFNKQFLNLYFKVYCFFMK